MVNEKKELVKSGIKIYERGLVAGTWGNLSHRLEKEPEKIAITPSGIDYTEVGEEDIVILNLAGEIKEGKRKPSTEYQLHTKIYKSRKDVNAIVHTHSTFASAVACSRKDIPPIVEDMVQIVGGSVETAEYKLPGTKDLADSAMSALGNKKAVLLANHGVVAVGEDMKEALKVAEITEKSAKIHVFSKLLGSPHKLSKDDVEKMTKMYSKDYGQK